MNPEDQSPSGPENSPEPIEPGRAFDRPPTESPTRELKKNRGDLVVLLGIGSLFCCPPLGLLAWIMASSDLKRIRDGEMSSEGIGSVRAGRVLGILGTLFFSFMLVLSTIAVYRLPDSVANMKGLFNKRMERFKKDVQKDLTPSPLPQNQLVYAGLWIGDRGTVIRIARSGIAGYEYRKDRMTSKQTGGRVRIEGGKLSIGIFGIYSTWKIDQPPKATNGIWTMILDGEKFTRAGEAPMEPDGGHAGPGPQEYEI